MNSIPVDLVSFLEEINRSNRERATVRGFPANTFRRLGFNYSLEMYEIASGYEISSAYDGAESEETFCLEEEAFLRVIQALRANSIVMIDADAIRVVRAGSWDHSYSSPEDSAYAEIQKGHLVGTLEIRGSLMAPFNLQFSPYGEKKEFRTDTRSAIDVATIREAIISLKDDSRLPGSKR